MELVFFCYRATLLTHDPLDCHVIQILFCKDLRYLRTDQIRKKMRQKTHWVTQSSLWLMSLGPLPHWAMGSFSLVSLLLAMHFQKPFFIVLHISASFNSRWTLAFLTSSLYVQGLSPNSSLLPPSMHFIFHLSSEVVPILSVLASAVLPWLSEDQVS